MPYFDIIFFLTEKERKKLIKKPEFLSG